MCIPFHLYDNQTTLRIVLRFVTALAGPLMSSAGISWMSRIWEYMQRQQYKYAPYYLVAEVYVDVTVHVLWELDDIQLPWQRHINSTGWSSIQLEAQFQVRNVIQNMLPWFSPFHTSTECSVLVLQLNDWNSAVLEKPRRSALLIAGSRTRVHVRKLSRVGEASLQCRKQEVRAGFGGDSWWRAIHSPFSLRFHVSAHNCLVNYISSQPTFTFGTKEPTSCER